MAKFVICTEEMEYSITDTNILCLLVDDGENCMEVKVVSGPNRGSRQLYSVEKRYFKEVTLEWYLENFPEMEIDRPLIETLFGEKNKNVPDPVMKFDGKHIPNEEEYSKLITECMELLEEYSYSPTEEGIREFLDVYFANKGELINVFAKHPNYNGKYQIAFDQNYEKTVDIRGINEFFSWIFANLDNLVEPFRVKGFTYKDIYSGGPKESDFYALSESERVEIYNAMANLTSGDDCIRYNCNRYKREDEAKIDQIKNFAYFVDRGTETFLSNEGGLVDDINAFFPDIKAVEGQKMSRVVNKIAKLIGFDKLPDYNKEFAKYSDAINPLKIVRHTVLSLHPVDYLTMSFGNSWSSCHTIDKKNKRGMPNSYEGIYSAGTMSYMLDESSFVFYTVDASYNGDNLELQPKISRCMFHVGHDKLIQARMYPQSSDGNSGLYKDVREIVQKVISECFDFPNFWVIEKGTEACGEYSKTSGLHYRDYLNFNYCNVTFPKNDEGYKNSNRINIGHNPICPSCGKEHYNANSIECHDCMHSDEMMCENCGVYYDADEMREINGRYYCPDCCFYCDYHERWEAISPEDIWYVYGYGNICDEARYDSGDFYYCEYCGETHLITDDHIETDDENAYCCEEHAVRDGYVLTVNDGWVKKYRTFICVKCGEVHHVDDLSDTPLTCARCANEKEEEVA